MPEKDPNIDYYNLISSYLSGNATDQEVSLLEKWVLADPENKATFQAYKKAWIYSGLKENRVKVEVEKEWEKTASQLFPKDKVVKMPVKPQRNLVPIWRAAAAIAILVVAALWWFKGTSNPEWIEVMAQNEVADENLPDGTTISLNQYATLKYAPDYGQQFRKVELKGDAFFDVERDPEHPFIIQTQEIEVKVLGTSFYVDSRPKQDEIQVIVKTGVVEVNNGIDKVQLVANETGIYSKKTKTLTKTATNDDNYLAWKTNALIFEDSNLEEVIFAINRKFHAEVTIENEALKNCIITATYKDKTLDNIIRILEKTLDLKANKAGDKIVFSGAGCE